MQAETTSARRRAVKRALLWLVLSVAVVVTIAAVGALLVRHRGRVRRDAALDRIRARGEPIRLVDCMPAPMAFGEDPLAWLVDFGELPQAEVDSRQTAECAGVAAKDAADFRDDVLDPTDIDAATPCAAALLHRRLELDRARTERALEVERLASIDWSRVVHPVGTAQALVPRAPIAEAIEVVRTLIDAALDSALRGENATAVRDLDLAARAAELFRDGPLVIHQVCWTHSQALVCAAIVRIAALLPQSARLDAIDARLAGVAPRALLRRSMLCERANGIEVFALIRDRKSENVGFDALDGLTRFFHAWWIEHDEADFLEEMERVLESTSSPNAVSGIADRKPRSLSVVSVMLLPQWEHQIALATRVEAQLLLARAALVAHRDGIDAARAWASAQRDPFVDQPLHTRIDADGALSIWSVSANLVDDGAPLATSNASSWIARIPPDILARCPPR